MQPSTGLDRQVQIGAVAKITTMRTQLTDMPSTLPASASIVTRLEQQLAYRVHAYLAEGRQQDSVFSLPALRMWMLGQTWPFPVPSTRLECLAVLSWSAICAIEAEPEREVVIRGELGRQMDYLDGANVRRPVSLDAFQPAQARIALYTNLRTAAEPGSSRRQIVGLPRFNAADKLD